MILQVLQLRFAFPRLVRVRALAHEPRLRIVQEIRQRQRLGKANGNVRAIHTARRRRDAPIERGCESCAAAAARSGGGT